VPHQKDVAVVVGQWWWWEEGRWGGELGDSQRSESGRVEKPAEITRVFVFVPACLKRGTQGEWWLVVGGCGRGDRGDRGSVGGTG